MVVFLGQVGIEREPRANVRFCAHIGRCRRISSGNVNRRVERPSRESARIEPGRTAWRDVLEKACFPMQRLPTWDRCNEPTHENRDFQYINNIKRRLPNLLDWLGAAKPDIVCLQELKATDTEFPIMAIERAGYQAVWRGQKSWNGVAILARHGKPVLTRTELPGDPSDTEARYIEALHSSLHALNREMWWERPPPGWKWIAQQSSLHMIAICVPPAARYFDLHASIAPNTGATVADQRADTRLP